MNPVVVSVVVLTALCLLKFNIIIAIILSAVLAGLMAGMDMNTIMIAFIGGEIDGVRYGGMAGSNQVALSYILLGALAYGISGTGLAAKFADVLERVFGKTGKWFVVILAGVASLSQNVIPIHIAFIPILIPPLLYLMNRMKIDRRAAACALTYGLKAPYMLVPMGFGIIFHGIVSGNMTANGMEIYAGEIWSAAILPAIGMTVGLFVAIFITYRKDRHYEDLPLIGMPEADEESKKGFTIRHWGALVGALAAFATQMILRFITGTSAMWALPLGATIGILIMVATGAIRYKEFDKTLKGGIGLMGFIAFIMLVASGYGSVMSATGGVDSLVEWALGVVGNNRLGAIIAMQFVGLLITMGIGTSFGTIPIIAAIFVPFCLAMGFSPMATAALLISAGVTGDAGTPASDSTLGPTAGLAADGQHDHIYDTCIPTFLHFNIPIIIMGTIAAYIL
ncbi:MAG: TRAP transporter large permease subunit [Defluviitaleaceae bacterium]|nr:TRAP transporter large permease subunit [Defluviitaleaceae bacterium]